MKTWIIISEMVKNIFNIAFYIVTGTLAIYTYRQAKRAFFSPFNNEIFKKQVKKLEKFTESYGRITSEDDLYTSHRFDEIFIYNWMVVYVKVKEPKNDPNELLDGERRRMFIELSGPTTTESRLFPRYFIEKEDEVPNLQVSHNYRIISNSIKEILTSNYIPKSIQQKVILLQDSTEKILLEISEHIKNDIPKIKTTSDNNIEGSMNSLKSFDPSKTNLYEKYIDCLNTIREYLNSDKIMD